VKNVYAILVGTKPATLYVWYMLAKSGGTQAGGSSKNAASPRNLEWWIDGCDAFLTAIASPAGDRKRSPQLW
jgi:hypothetical protein